LSAQRETGRPFTSIVSVLVDFAGAVFPVRPALQLVAVFPARPALQLVAVFPARPALQLAAVFPARPALQLVAVFPVRRAWQLVAVFPARPRRWCACRSCAQGTASSRTCEANYPEEKISLEGGYQGLPARNLHRCSRGQRGCPSGHYGIEKLWYNTIFSR